MIRIIYKITTNLILFILFVISLVSCEDVINVNLDEGQPKLVIEASILWQKGTTGENQTISLSKSSSYYENQIIPANNALVTITNGIYIFNFIEDGTTGNYICSNFIPVIGNTYTLTVVFEGQTYTSTEKFIGVPTIDSVEQSVFNGFGNDAVQVKFYFDDIGTEDNFYFIKSKSSIKLLPEYDVIDDSFTQGNQMFGLYVDEDLKPNDQLDFTLYGINERYYNYMNILLGQAGGNGGSPFSTAPATIRGNIINNTNEANFPFGYFHLSETDIESYSVQ